MEKPRVLVGCPTYDGKEYCLKEYIEGLKSLTYDNFEVCIADNSRKPEYFKKIREIAGDWNSGRKQKFSVKKVGYNSDIARQRIVESRNVLREKALNEGFDYFFSLEQDLIPPPDCIERLLERKRKVISGTYFNIVPERSAVTVLAYKGIGKNAEGKVIHKTLDLFELFPSRLIEGLLATGIGCMLIHMDVLKKVKFRFVEEEKAFDDWWFCEDATAIGEPVVLDTSMFFGHNYRAWVKDKNY